ncbi:hypothetical protein HIM_05989 [Hirsutella minnesotensis 3608]|uniref:Crh-like protein n=1 Tax=Hirsutella minnesotensis 3608 TaxID=1043627 RepID=A0A0F8A535_9HYPO|nr:hypothetical protein HIM_05989 [Hirsutella minnesotensis 3608]
MYTKSWTAAAVALAASGLVSAQTFTSCNPMEKTCPSDPAMGNTVTCDFTKGKCDAFTAAEGTSITYGNKGAVFTIKNGEAPTIHTPKYIFFGKVEVDLQCAPGRGIITSVVLQSDDLDEVDFEWIGSDTAQVQSNYFGKGDTTTYDRGKFHPVANPASQSYKYGFEWTKDKIEWSINGQVIRTLSYQDAKGGSRYPQTPMQIKLGTWAAPTSDDPKFKGTQDWAGGKPDFSKGPFEAFYKSITITDYAGGDKPADGGIKEYVFGDKTGSWQSIKVVKGQSDSVRNENGIQGNGNGGLSHSENKSAIQNAESTPGPSSSVGSPSATASSVQSRTTLGSPASGSNGTVSSRPSNGSRTSGSPGPTVSSSAGRYLASLGGLAVAGAAVVGQLTL